MIAPQNTMDAWFTNSYLMTCLLNRFSWNLAIHFKYTFLLCGFCQYPWSFRMFIVNILNSSIFLKLSFNSSIGSVWNSFLNCCFEDAVLFRLNFFCLNLSSLIIFIVLNLKRNRNCESSAVKVCIHFSDTLYIYFWIYMSGRRIHVYIVFIPVLSFYFLSFFFLFVNCDGWICSCNNNQEKIKSFLKEL